MSEFNWAAATPEQFRAHWVTELRSGKYQQGQGFLQTSTGFCCLGVLCDIYDSSRWTDAEDYLFEGEVHDTWPPKSILDAVGLGMDQADYLACANDAGVSFAEIADSIEQNKLSNLIEEDY